MEKFHQVKNSNPGDELENKINELTAEIVADVFHKARNAKGKERLDCVQRIKKFGETVGREKYNTVLKGLMTNDVAIDELERLGKEELVNEVKTKFKKLIPWNK